MKYFATITGRKELYLFNAKGYEEANFICGGFHYIELYVPCRNICIPKDELSGYTRELYEDLTNRKYKKICI